MTRSQKGISTIAGIDYHWAIASFSSGLKKAKTDQLAPSRNPDPEVGAVDEGDQTCHVTRDDGNLPIKPPRES